MEAGEHTLEVPARRAVRNGAAVLVAAGVCWGCLVLLLPAGGREERELRTPHFLLRTRVGGLPLGELGAIMERTRAETRCWLGLPVEPRERAAVLAVHLLRDTEELFALERSRGLAYAGDPRRARWRQPGGFYRDVPMIAVVVDRASIARTVSHEVVHSVLERTAPVLPDVLDEGVAMLLSERTLAGMGGHEALLARVREEQAAVLSRCVEIPRLALLFASSYGEFRGPADGRNFVFALVLVRLLDADAGPALAASLLRMDRPRDAWAQFRELFPADRIESAWREEIGRLARR